jgi:hypothetical protein
MVTESEFAGKWKVVEALDSSEDYLNLSPDPHIFINVDEKNEVTGSYEFGAQDGFIDGRFEQDKKESLRLICSFEGCDEGDQENGFGTFCFESEDMFLLTMHYHMGDTFRLRCQATHDGENTLQSRH